MTEILIGIALWLAACLIAALLCWRLGRKVRRDEDHAAVEGAPPSSWREVSGRR